MEHLNAHLNLYFDSFKRQFPRKQSAPASDRNVSSLMKDVMGVSGLNAGVDDKLIDLNFGISDYLLKDHNPKVLLDFSCTQGKTPSILHSITKFYKDTSIFEEVRASLPPSIVNMLQ